MPDPPRALPGRQRERDLFLECLARATSGMATLLLFEGEAGSGRSALLAELAASPVMPRRHVRVLGLALEPGDRPVARAAHSVRSRITTRSASRRQLLGTAGRLLPGWMGTLPVIGPVLAATLETARALRRRRHSPTIGALPDDIIAVHGAARRRPLVLFLDGMENLDENAVEGLRRLIADAEGGTRLLVTGAFRTPAPGCGPPPVRSLITRLPLRTRHHCLAPLDAAGLLEWLEYRFPGAKPPAALANHLLEETGGQPGALRALIDRLVDAGAIRRDGDNWTFDIEPDVPLPADTGIADSAPPDLGALTPDAAAAVIAASILGDLFDGFTLARTLDLDELDIEDHLAVAVRYGIIQVAGTRPLQDGDIATTYRFASSALRASLRRGMTADRRRALEDAARRAVPSTDH